MKQYFILNEMDEQSGPISEAELIAAYKEHRYHEKCRGWCEGMNGWQHLATIMVELGVATPRVSPATRLATLRGNPLPFKRPTATHQQIVNSVNAVSSTASGNASVRCNTMAATPPNEISTQVPPQSYTRNKKYKSYSFSTATVDALKRFADFRGRSTRSAYGCWYLMNIFILIVLPLSQVEIICAFVVLWCLVSIIPTLSLTVRRLHDMGLSGWFGLCLCIPYLNFLALLAILFIDSNEGRNKWGNSEKYPAASL